MTCPAYITTTWSQTWATTARSWVIRSTPVPRSVHSALISASTWPWTVTSRAVVGSSAIKTCGSLTSAAAITTRWRIPPEKRCGGSR